jgi:hypothetical protein
MIGVAKLALEDERSVRDFPDTDLYFLDGGKPNV